MITNEQASVALIFVTKNKQSNLFYSNLGIITNKPTTGTQTLGRLKKLLNFCSSNLGIRTNEQTLL
jgi:hypothetical protein